MLLYKDGWHHKSFIILSQSKEQLWVNIIQQEMHIKLSIYVHSMEWWEVSPDVKPTIK